MAESTPKQQNALVDYYVSRYKKKYKREPLFNRQSGTWTFKTMLYDYTAKEIKSLIDFFFEKYKHPDHDLQWFGYNYDKLIAEKQAHEKRVEEFTSLRRESMERARQWKEKVERVKGNQDSSTER